MGRVAFNKILIHHSGEDIDIVELLELAKIIGFDPHEVLDELVKTPKK